MKNNDKTRQTSAVQAFIETFGSMDELLEWFDALIFRITLTHWGGVHAGYDLVGDYDLIKQLKQAISADLVGQSLPYAAQSAYEDLAQRIDSPHATSATQALKIGKAMGILNFEVAKLNGEYVLKTHWTQADVTAYQADTQQTLWGSFSARDGSGFMFRFLRLMSNEDTK